MGVASTLDRRIQFRRATQTADEFGGFTLTWADHGSAVAAAREDVSDSERVQAAAFRERSMIRFTVRDTPFTRDITAADRIVHEGVAYGIVGVKKPRRGQRRQLLEITVEGPVK